MKRRRLQLEPATVLSADILDQCGRTPGSAGCMTGGERADKCRERITEKLREPRSSSETLTICGTGELGGITERITRVQEDENNQFWRRHCVSCSVQYPNLICDSTERRCQVNLTSCQAAMPTCPVGFGSTRPLLLTPTRKANLLVDVIWASPRCCVGRCRGVGGVTAKILREGSRTHDTESGSPIQTSIPLSTGH